MNKGSKQIFNRLAAMVLAGSMVLSQLAPPALTVLAQEEMVAAAAATEGAGEDAAADNVQETQATEDTQETPGFAGADQGETDPAANEPEEDTGNPATGDDELISSETAGTEETFGESETDDELIIGDGLDDELIIGDMPEEEQEIEEEEVPFEELLGEEAEPEASRVRFAVKYVSGGQASALRPGETVSEDFIILGNRETVKVELQADLGSAAQGSRAEELFFELALPILYEEQGVIRFAYDNDDVPRDGKIIGRVKAVFQEEPSGWFVESNKPYGGTNTFESGLDVTQGTTRGLAVNLYFEAEEGQSIPDNTKAMVYLGGGYKDFVVGGSSYGPGYTSADENTAKYGMIYTNLKWETEITAVGENVLWDKYNYLVYKMTVRNTSEDAGSTIDGLDFLLDVPDEDDNTVGGLLREDAMKWLYVNGGAVENDGTASTESAFIGKPGEGGVLVYDVTGISEETLGGWHLDTFDNVEQPLLPYYFVDGNNINIQLADITRDNCIRKGEEKVYYIAVPMTTNFSKESMENISSRLYSTVTFGGDYTWTKIVNGRNRFVEPSVNFSGLKYVLENDDDLRTETNPALQNKDAAIGESVNYYLDNFENVGNVPVFNAYAQDTMHEDFVLERISVEMYQDGQESTPSLTDWFREEGTIVLEFAWTDSEGQMRSEFVELGTLALDTEKSQGAKTVWSLDAGTAVENYIKAQQAAFSDIHFTNRFWIYFKERLEAEKKLNGRVVVNGTIPLGGVTYDNKLDTMYEKRQWNTTRKEYDKMDYDSEARLVSINAIPAIPQIQVDAYTPATGGTRYADELETPINISESGFRYMLGNETYSRVIPGVFNSGDLLLGVPEDADGTGTEEPEGFITERLIFSKALFENPQTSIGEVKIRVWDGNSASVVTLTKEEVESALVTDEETQDRYLPASCWRGANNAEAVSFTVVFDAFTNNQPLSEDVYVAADGHSNVVENIEVNGEFRTDYHREDLDKTAEDRALMIVQTINPVLTGYSFAKEGDTQVTSGINENKIEVVVDKLGNESEVKGQKVIHELTAANKQQDTGYNFVTQTSHTY